MEKLTTLLENVSNWVKNSVTLKLMTYDFNALPEGQRVLKNASFLIQLLMKNISFMKFFKLFFILFSSIYSLQAQHVDYQKPVNPFKLYSPSFNEARENNNKYQEWGIKNIGGVHKRKIFYNNDSIACVVSGQKELPFAANFFACYTFPLLKNIKKLKIGLVYGFLSYQNTDLSFSVIFNNKTALLKEKKIILEPTFSFNDKNLILEFKEIEVDIPKLSNNFITDNGTQVIAYRNSQGAPSGVTTDCHGVTFADGGLWIDNNQVTTILTGDNYTQNTGNHNVGNIVVYYDASGGIVHSATIDAAGTGCTSTVTGLGGTQTQTSSCSIEDGFDNYSYYTVYSN